MFDYWGVAVGGGFGDALEVCVGVDDDDGAVGFFYVEGGAEPLVLEFVGAGEAEGANVGDFHGLCGLVGGWVGVIMRRVVGVCQWVVGLGLTVR